MPKSLADGHIRLAILTTKPANEAAPTVAELNGGIGGATGISCNILSTDFVFGAVDSERVTEPALCTDIKANAIGAGNYQAGLTVFRYFDGVTLNPSVTEDVLFTGLKVKGTELWMYARKTAKLSTVAFLAADELYLGAKIITDTPQAPTDGGGYIKYRVPMEPQLAWPFIAVA